MTKFLQSKISFFVLLLMVIHFSGCASIKGVTREDKRQYVLDMQEGVLEDLYRLKPIARTQIENSAGYGVFSNINSHLMFVGTVTGYGVVRDNSMGEDTYMKMFGLGGGFGFGIKDFRAVLIFKKGEDLVRFIEKGWDFHGQVDVMAQSTDKGASISGAQSLNLDIITYQLTESGLALDVTFQGKRFWNYRELN